MDSYPNLSALRLGPGSGCIPDRSQCVLSKSEVSIAYSNTGSLPNLHVELSDRPMVGWDTVGKIGIYEVRDMGEI